MHCHETFIGIEGVAVQTCGTCRKNGHGFEGGICRKCQEMFRNDQLEHYPNHPERARRENRTMTPRLKGPDAA